MGPIAFVPWLVLAVVLAAFAPKIRTPIVGAVLILAGIAPFAVRLHHEGPYPFGNPLDFVAGAIALGVGALLVRSPWSSPREGGATCGTRVLLGLAPFAFVLALVAYAHEAEEVVVLRTTGSEGSVRETRLWIVDYQGAPWIVTGRDSPHDLDLVANPRVEIFRRGEARCWTAERHLDQATLEKTLGARSEKYRTQRIALASGAWKLDQLEGIAVALRFTPCGDD